MISRGLRGRASARSLAPAAQPEPIVLVVVLAAIAAFGWVATPLGVAAAVAMELAIGGFGAVWIIGSAEARLGFARYATLALAGVAITLFGRLIVDRTGLLLVPLAAVLLWVALWAELDSQQRGRATLLVDLTLIGIVFAGAAGLSRLIPTDAWPPGLLLLLVLAATPVLRAAEARGASGVRAVGQAALHLLALAQVAAALALLRPPGVVGAALLALAFHAWGGAATALEDGEPGWRVAIEFGALGLMGVVLALLLQSR
jgi:hypothetical protein